MCLQDGRPLLHHDKPVFQHRVCSGALHHREEALCVCERMPTGFCCFIQSVYITWVLVCICDRHEYISGYYRVSVYFLAKILADITMRTITSVIFSSIVYFLIGSIGSYL